MKRVVLFLVSSAALLLIASCGSSNNSVTGPNGNVTVNAPSKLTNRAFITNQFSGNIQIVDSQNDTTAYYSATNNNTGNSTSGGTTVGNTTVGAPSAAVSIIVGGSLTMEALRPDGAETAVYNPSSPTVTFITNSSEASNGSVPLSGWAGMLLYSADSTKMYIPVPTAAVTNSRPGGVEIVTEATSTTTVGITGFIPIPAARYVAISPDGKTLMVFASNSDTMFLVDLTATQLSPVAFTGFAAPVNAFFSSDNSTAYVINCGPECGSTAGPPSVMRFDMASRTVTATVPVGGASVGLLKNTTLYVAGFQGGSSGTFDVVDVSAMTRTTTNPVAIGDGSHTTMAISNNNKMYIGAVNCANITEGCLSIVDLGKNSLDTVSQPLGIVTGIQSIPNRNAMYVVEGGVLYIYDTTTGQLQSTQIAFVGALFGVVQVDP